MIDKKSSNLQKWSASYKLFGKSKILAEEVLNHLQQVDRPSAIIIHAALQKASLDQVDNLLNLIDKVEDKNEKIVLVDSAFKIFEQRFSKKSNLKILKKIIALSNIYPGNYSDNKTLMRAHILKYQFEN